MPGRCSLQACMHVLCLQTFIQWYGCVSEGHRCRAFACRACACTVRKRVCWSLLCFAQQTAPVDMPVRLTRSTHNLESQLFRAGTIAPLLSQSYFGTLLKYTALGVKRAWESMLL